MLPDPESDGVLVDVVGEDGGGGEDRGVGGGHDGGGERADAHDGHGWRTEVLQRQRQDEAVLLRCQRHGACVRRQVPVCTRRHTRTGCNMACSTLQSALRHTRTGCNMACSTLQSALRHTRTGVIWHAARCSLHCVIPGQV